MSDDTGILERVGEEVARELGAGPPQARRQAQRRDLLSIVATAERPSRLRHAVVATAAAIAVVTIGMVVFQRNMNPLPFWIGDELVAGNEGSWLESTTGEKLAVRFEGGSRMDLSNETAARVVESTTEEVRVDLGNGKLAAKIQGNGRTKWTVGAGPYQIAVMGTSFSVLWNEDGAALDVAVSDGIVMVSGAGLNNPGVRLTAGERLQVDKNRVIVSTDPPQPVPTDEEETPLSEPDIAAQDAPDREVDVLGEVSESAADTNSGRRNTKRAKSETTAWKDLYDQKDYAGAIAAAERGGLDELLRSLDREDLWKLANAARYARRGEKSVEVLERIRTRFKGTRRAQAATFLLGRVSLELRRDPAGARNWFQTYLDENPIGPLSEEALGRLVDACEKTGDKKAARRHASRYLSRYPDGLFAELARSALKK